MAGEWLAQDHALIDLARPLNPPDLTITEPTVELDKMFGLLGCIHGQLDEAGLPGPKLGALEKHATNAFALVLRGDGKLVGTSDTWLGEVLAMILRVGRLNDDGSYQLGLNVGDKARATADALGGDFGGLIDGGVVETHGARRA
jgi:hypothetical protein